MRSIKYCILAAALCCMVPAVAQKNFGSAKYTAMCSYYGESITGNIVAYESGAAAQNAVAKIMSVIGLKPNFELRVANVPNAAAVLIKSKRYILYNPKFMDQINNASGTNWAAISILAHEIGHHLNGHTLDNVGSRPQTELEADEFSGFVLRKMGATLYDAQAVMSIISSERGSHSHPAKADRLAYIETGWKNAAPVKDPATPPVKENNNIAVAPNRQNSTRTPANTVVYKDKPLAKSKTVSSTPRVENRAKKINESVNSANVVSIAYFDSDPRGHYYLTKRGNIVQVEGDKVYQVAKMYKSDRAGYSLMFADKGTNRIYVGRNGLLVNTAGSKVGYLKTR